jgi:hypothetical protein
LIFDLGMSNSGAIDGTLSEIDRLLTVNKRAERGRRESHIQIQYFIHRTIQSIYKS